MASVGHRIERTGGETVLLFDGEIDLSNARDVRGVILEALAKAPSLAVDLSAVRYMDSSGVANLIEGFQKARAGKKGFRVANPSEPVRLVLRMAKLEKILVG